MRRRAALLLVLLCFAGGSLASAQESARERTLRRWTEASARLADAEPPDPRAVVCATRARSCECVGLPSGPQSQLIDPEEVGERMLRCVDNSLHGPGPRGRVMLELTVAPDGRPTGGRVVSNETGDAAVASCLLRAALGARLSPHPARLGAQLVRFPVIFEPPPDELPPDELRASGSSTTR